MTQGTENPDGFYPRPPTIVEAGWPNSELPYVGNHVQHADRFNFIIAALNVIRLCTPSVLSMPQGDAAGTYLRPKSVTEIDWPNQAIPHFPVDVQHASRFNFLLDALNALRACAYSLSPVPEQGRNNLDGTYRIPLTVAEYGYPCDPLPYFENDVQHATLFNMIIDALNDAGGCCPDCVSCATPDTSTTAATSGLSATRDKGDDFSAWGLGDYAAFFADSHTNPNYENGIPYNAINNPSPGAFLEDNFDEFGALTVNRNRISQSSANGGHRSVKAIKLQGDGEFDAFGFEIFADGVIGGKNYQALWTRTRFQFSTNFAVYDTATPHGRGIIVAEVEQSWPDTLATPAKLADIGVWNKGMYPLRDPDAEDMLQVHMQATTNGITNYGGLFAGYTEDVGTMRELLFTGTPRELVMFAGWIGTFSNQYRVAAWLYDAFGTPVKLFDYTRPVANPVNLAGLQLFRATDPYVLKPDQGAAMCYECLTWELEDGNVVADPYGVESAAWGPYGPPPANAFFAGRTALAATSSGVLVIPKITIERGQKEAAAPHVSSFERTLWYTWTAPANGTATFDTEASVTAGLDTILGVYTGTVLGSLVQIAYNDDDVGSLSKVTFTAVSGTVYVIQVGRYNNSIASGPITLTWSLV